MTKWDLKYLFQSDEDFDNCLRATNDKIAEFKERGLNGTNKVQYGMAEINFKNLSKAEMYLNNSYSLAKGKEGYDTTDIDTQYARLLILKSLLESNGTIVISLFMKAHNLLINLPNDHYRARQVYLYKEFYDKKYKILNEKGKTTYKNACNQMLESMKSVDKTSNIRDPNFINYRLIKFFDSLLKE